MRAKFNPKFVKAAVSHIMAISLALLVSRSVCPAILLTLNITEAAAINGIIKGPAAANSTVENRSNNGSPSTETPKADGITNISEYLNERERIVLTSSILFSSYSLDSAASIRSVKGPR